MLERKKNLFKFFIKENSIWYITYLHHRINQMLWEKKKPQHVEKYMQTYKGTINHNAIIW